MDKATRHKLIKEIVATEPISVQEELVEALRRRGLEVTQATVSRDIAQIPLQKVRTGAGLVYHWQGPVAEPSSRLARMVGEYVLTLDRSENLVLLKTTPGLAAPIAICIDETRLEPVLGTIAGDDTVLVVAKDREAGERALNLFRTMLDRGQTLS